MYETSEAYEIYSLYNALKQHFTSTSYDYFKYNGKTNVSPTSFERRKDKYQFYKLSKRKDAKNFILSNIVQNPKVWIGDLREDVYKDWMKRTQAFTRTVQVEIEDIDDLKSEIVVTNGQYPKLLHRYLSGQISLETLIALDDVIKFFNHWNKNLNDGIIWCDIYTLCRKYRPFLHYDRERIRNLIIDKCR